MALSGKKTIILGMDLRKPRIIDYFKTESEKGITNYLINDSTLEEVIQPTGYANLDCIPSGPIPPNPAELMASEKMAELFKSLKEIYDYIIIDTSPVFSSRCTAFEPLLRCHALYSQAQIHH